MSSVAMQEVRHPLVGTSLTYYSYCIAGRRLHTHRCGTGTAGQDSRTYISSTPTSHSPSQAQKRACRSATRQHQCQHLFTISPALHAWPTNNCTRVTESRERREGNHLTQAGCHDHAPPATVTGIFGVLLLLATPRIEGTHQGALRRRFLTGSVMITCTP